MAWGSSHASSRHVPSPPSFSSIKVPILFKLSSIISTSKFLPVSLGRYCRHSPGNFQHRNLVKVWVGLVTGRSEKTVWCVMSYEDWERNLCPFCLTSSPRSHTLFLVSFSDYSKKRDRDVSLMCCSFYPKREARRV